MRGINMHHIVRPAIQRINPDVTAVVYVSTGHEMLDGISTPTFLGVTARLQVQALSHESLAHLNGLQSAKAMRSVHAYGNFKAVNRPEGTGGAVVQLSDGWWAIQHVLEWWDDWCSFSITQQLNATTIEDLMQQIANGAVPVEP